MVPFPAGGGNDALARLVAERMSKTLGQQVVVENRGGAGGTVATRAIAKSPPDGHTILLSYTGTFAINPTLYPNAGYDPRKDFVADRLDRDADQRAGDASVAAGANRPRELIAYAKANPGQDQLRASCPARSATSRPRCSRAAPASRSPRSPTRATATRSPTCSAATCQMMFLSILPVIGQIQGGTLNALAVASPERVVAHPGRADDRGIRPARLLGGHHLRARGAGGHAARRSSSG